MTRPVLPDPPEVRARFDEGLELVEIIANQLRQKAGYDAPREDLVSAGRQGLLEAARRFDAQRGVPFRTFANYRIRGAMLDTIRRLSRLPHTVYRRLLSAQASALVSEGAVEYELHRPGSAEDAAEAEDALAQHLAGMATAAALGMIRSRRDEEELAEPLAPSPEEQFEQAELAAVVRRTIEGLPPDELEIVRRFYLEGQRLEDIGRDLELSKSWASRIHTRAIARLSKRLRGVQ